METVTQLTNQLVASYAKVGGINHLDGKNLPSKRDNWYRLVNKIHALCQKPRD